MPTIGFLPESQLKLHFSDRNEVPSIPELRTFSQRDNQRFNRIRLTGQPTALAQLAEGEQLEIGALGGVALIQSGTATAVRIDLSNWEMEREALVDVVLTAATLQFRIAPSSPQEEEELPRVVEVTWLNVENQIISFNDPASLVRDLEFGRDTYYEVNLRSFFRALLEEEIEATTGLQLSLSLGGDEATQLLIDGRSGEGPELLLTYVKIKEN